MQQCPLRLSFDDQGRLQTQATSANTVEFVGSDGQQQVIDVSFGDPIDDGGTGLLGTAEVAGAPSAVLTITTDTDGHIHWGQHESTFVGLIQDGSPGGSRSTPALCAAHTCARSPLDPLIIVPLAFLGVRCRQRKMDLGL